MNTSHITREAQFQDALSIAMLKIQVWLDTYATEGLSKEYAVYLASEITKEKTEAIIRDANKNSF
ncbi:MAG: hypothetical protein ACERIH_01105 [Labilibaculum antarcticum]